MFNVRRSTSNRKIVSSRDESLEIVQKSQVFNSHRLNNFLSFGWVHFCANECRRICAVWYLLKHSAGFPNNSSRAADWHYGKVRNGRRIEIWNQYLRCSVRSITDINCRSELRNVFWRESLTIWIACSYRSLSAVIWFAVAFCSNPLELSFLDSFSVVRYLEFIVDKTATEKWKGRNWKFIFNTFFSFWCASRHWGFEMKWTFFFQEKQFVDRDYSHPSSQCSTPLNCQLGVAAARGSFHSRAIASLGSGELIFQLFCNARVHAVDSYSAQLVNHWLTLKLRVERNGDRRPPKYSRWGPQQSWALPVSRCVRAVFMLWVK